MQPGVNTVQDDFDILIVGGGLVGASVALALAKGLRVALLERAEPPALAVLPQDWDARIFAISPGSQAFLAGLGVWPSPRAGRIREMDVRGDAGGAIRFDALELGSEQLAATVENRLLQATLWRALQGKVELIAPALPQAFHADERSASVTLADGRVLRSKLVVAADGANSWLREQAGIAFSRQSYGQQGVVGNFRCARPHGDIARQWFRDDGVLAWLPLPDNLISIVWATDDASAAQLLALSPAALASRVAAAGGRALGDLQPLGKAAAFPLSLGRAASIIGTRLALVGDAAHTIHPLAGQGVNLGFGDAKALAALLDQACGRDPGDAMLLQRYRRMRAEEVLLMQSVCDGLQKLFALADPLSGRLRNLGLNLTNQAGPLKRAMMRHAFK
ncbi:UbiH/UbiF family hydroxylase [Chitinimonas arctica]|uniref:UbiH/UbiF family hydroxylase n=1 Tax=Chitinimonas arctica TaxID=2594795 RepID=A0A516SGU8_9NEIS|nr:UbiH/UbiF family hydroxylase [Chitinimonas arctica]QDQ27330.1 UbiH/UbiF family hydroxylase [Chitinimonas arctica]